MPIQSADQLVDLSQGSAGVEVVVHGVEEPLAQLPDLADEWGIGLLRLRAVLLDGQLVEALAGQAPEPVKEVVKGLEAAADRFESQGAVVGWPAVVRA